MPARPARGAPAGPLRTRRSPTAARTVKPRDAFACAASVLDRCADSAHISITHSCSARADWVHLSPSRSRDGARLPRRRGVDPIPSMDGVRHTCRRGARTPPPFPSTDGGGGERTQPASDLASPYPALGRRGGWHLAAPSAGIQPEHHGEVKTPPAGLPAAPAAMRGTPHHWERRGRNGPAHAR